MDKFATLMSILIFALFGAILYYVMIPRVVVQQVPVYTEVIDRSIDWLPWGWGWGSHNNIGSAVIHRPQPHFPFHPPRPSPHHRPSPGPGPSPRPSPGPGPSPRPSPGPGPSPRPSPGPGPAPHH